MSDCNHTEGKTVFGNLERCDYCGEVVRELASARLLAARVVVNQDLVDEIVRRAKESEYGLDDPEKKPDITQYQPGSFETLSHCLVSSWTAKYDLVSVFSAAMSVIQEKAANGGTERPPI